MGKYAMRRARLYPHAAVSDGHGVRPVLDRPGDPAVTILGAVRVTAARSHQNSSNACGRRWVWTGPFTSSTRAGCRVLHGDLGTSLWYKTPVWTQLKDRFLVTMELAVMAILLAFCAAVPLGITSAVKQDTGLDYCSRVFCVIGVALPTFWFGILIVYALASFFQWLPPLGYATLWDDPLLNLQQLIFPALTLASLTSPLWPRGHAGHAEVMREDYLRTARAKGLREIVIGRHALSAFLPVVTVSGYQFGRLLGGVIIVESIFCGARHGDAVD